MLKLIYTELGLHMERVVADLDAIVSQRVILAIRTGETLYVEPGEASFLLPIDTDGLARLKQAQGQEKTPTLDVISVDNAYVEVSLEGTWIAASIDAQDGTFIANYTDETEGLVYRLWQVSQAEISFLA